MLYILTTESYVTHYSVIHFDVSLHSETVTYWNVYIYPNNNNMIEVLGYGKLSYIDYVITEVDFKGVTLTLHVIG